MASLLLWPAAGCSHRVPHEGGADHAAETPNSSAAAANGESPIATDEKRTPADAAKEPKAKQPDAAKKPANSGKPGMPSAERIAWELGGKLSSAALAHGRGASDEVVRGMFSKAKVLADALGTKIPPLPDRIGSRAADQSAVVDFLLGPAGESIGGQLADEHGPEHAALFELALKSNLLALLYAPGDSSGETLSEMIRNRAADADLPDALCAPLLTKLSEQASPDDVNAALLKMHKDVGGHLSR